MFAPGPEPSKDEIKAGEAQANQTVRMAITGGVLLYLCTSTQLRWTLFLARSQVKLTIDFE
ncbi:hypothetical protein BDV18DRAFT_132011 [Aspergillus unguis]